MINTNKKQHDVNVYVYVLIFFLICKLFVILLITLYNEIVLFFKNVAKLFWLVKVGWGVSFGCQGYLLGSLNGSGYDRSSMKQSRQMVGVINNVQKLIRGKVWCHRPKWENIILKTNMMRQNNLLSFNTQGLVPTVLRSVT